MPSPDVDGMRSRLGWIDAGDIAAVAGAVLLEHNPVRAEHILTDPQTLSYAETAGCYRGRAKWLRTRSGYSGTTALGRCSKRE